MPEATQFCIGLENKPGVLARLCADMRARRVRIEALFVSDDDDFCWVNLVATPPDEAREMLSEGGYNFFTENVMVIKVNDPGEIEAIAQRLGTQGVNINNVYGSCTPGCPSTLVLNVSDLPAALSTVAC